MNILVYSLLYAVIAFAGSMDDNDFHGTHHEGHPLKLESEISNGDPPENQNDLLFTASLQINRTHKCGAGMFQLGFLLSSGSCVSNIREERANADVVMSQYDLNGEERLRILDLDIYRLFFGILRVEITEPIKNIGNTITFPVMSKNTFRITYHGNEAMLCGWNPTAGSEIFSNRIHCRTIWVQTWRACTHYNYEKGIDYQHRYHCGYLRSGEKLSLNDQGHLVTKRSPKYSQDKLQIIGIAVGGFDYKGRIYARFIKNAAIFDEFEKMLRKLEGISNTKDSESHIDSGSNNNTASGSRRVRDDHLTNDAHSGANVPNKHRRHQ